MALTAKRKWVYPASVKGRFQKVHRWSGIVLQALLFVTPWITFKGHPIVLVDFSDRRFYLLGGVYTATDTFFLVLIGLFLAFLLFFFTALYGRMWCGFLCPQTVFLEEWIRPIEKFLEGERGVRRRRDEGPWTFDKAWRKVAKWIIFFALAVAISMTFMSYFEPARVLWTGGGGVWDYGLVAAFTGTFFLDFVWFREQFCSYLCPYARFQGALTDEYSLVLAYHDRRGEPRRQKGLAKSEQGACIDCNKCVAVCPTGIDIRDGFQLECISCARCIDACQIVMDKLGKENLISFTTVAELEGKPGATRKPIRARTVAYAALLTGLTIAFVAKSAARHEIYASVQRVPGSLFQIDDDGMVRNTFLLKVANNHSETAQMTVDVSGLDGLDVRVPPFTVEPATDMTIPVVVRVPRTSMNGATSSIDLKVSAPFDSLVISTTFKGPDT